MAWKLTELANFEVLLHNGKVRAEERDAVASALAETSGSEADLRRAGLRAWYDSAMDHRRQTETSDEPGHRLSVALGLIQLIAVVVALVAGMVLMAGLVERVGVTEGKAYNVWKLIAIPIGGQWVFLILSILSWIILRRKSRKLTLLEEVIGQTVKKVAGREGAQAWNQLYRAGTTYRSLLGWRLGRITQWAAVAFNAGILASFYFILLFLEINFFWATTIDDFGLPQLQNVTAFMASPWSSFQPSWLPTEAQMIQTQLQVGELNPEGEAPPWYGFFIAAFIFWALMPRVIMTALCYVMEHRQRARLTFMEKRHRNLWRDLAPRVRSEVIIDTPDDGVVMIDVGGTSVDTEEVRPFLLQQLRVNPTQRYTAGVLSDDQKDAALSDLRSAKRGVILLVEDWSLSPKQLQPLHQKIRAAIQNREIFYLVVGLPREGKTQAPDPAELEQWQNFVVTLNDENAEVIAYQPRALNGSV